MYGNIYINVSQYPLGGSLTIKHATLTIDQAYAGEHNIFVNMFLNGTHNGGFTLTQASTLTTANSSAGSIWAYVNASANCPIHISNSTVNHVQFYDYASYDYYDNSTFHSSTLYFPTGGNKEYTNISYNSFRDLTYKCAIFEGGYNHTIITGNHFTAIDQTGGSNIGMITVSCSDGYGSGMRIIKNHFNQQIEVCGIYALAPYAAIISNNYFDGIYGGGDPEALAFTYAIIVLGEGADLWSGVWANVENNTICYLESQPGKYSTIGIYGNAATSHFNICNNTIWNITRTDNQYRGVGIWYSGDNAHIRYNHIGNVSGIADDIYGQPIGIAMSGSNINNLAYYGDISNNRIDKNYNSSVGICVSLASEIHIRNNTVAESGGYSGSGIGVYINIDHIWIRDNIVSGVDHNMMGFILGNNATDCDLKRNYVYVFDRGEHEMAQGSTNAAAAFDISADVDLANWTGDGCILVNNWVRHEPSEDYYPDYTVMSCNLDTFGDFVQIVLNESSSIQFYQSNFSVAGSANHIPKILSNTNVSYPTTVDGTAWQSNLGFGPGFASINVTLTNIGLTSSADVVVEVSLWQPTSTNTVAQWTALGTSGVTFTLSGLDSGKWYRVEIDGETLTSIQASGGSISFTYSGPWSEHEFKVIALPAESSIDAVRNFIPWAIGLVILFVMIGFAIMAYNEGFDFEDFIQLVAFLVIGLSIYTIVSRFFG